MQRGRALLFGGALVLWASTPGCGSPQAGSIDLSKTKIGIENEVREPVKPAARPPAPQRP
jgi:hypothetical protein